MTAPRGLYGIRRPSRTTLAALLRRGSSEELSYPEVGVTLALPADGTSAGAPAGSHLLRVERPIGNGPARFEEAKKAIVEWAGHRRAGAILQPERPAVQAGTDVALALRVWPIWVTATCRIVAVIDEPDRFGFAYGTLPHHPEAGEESFVVARDPGTDAVRLEIVAVSRPTALLAKLGGPVGRIFQRFMAGRYLDGFEHPTAMGQGPRASIRWWFENRETGQLTVAQFPNWPLFAIAGTTVVRRVTAAGNPLASGAVNDGSGWLLAGLWLYWGGDELVRGVNPWRRLLGVGVIGWQVARLLAR